MSDQAAVISAQRVTVILKALELSTWKLRIRAVVDS